jgi:hypothetical protein
MAESSRTTQGRRARTSAQPPEPPFGRSNDRLTAETTVQLQGSRMASLSCSALVKGKAHSARSALGTTCLKANVSKMPNNSFQRTLAPAGFGPLNSDR